MRDVISFVETEPTLGCLHIHDDAFSYQPHRGWAWLQRLCFRFLSWRQCHYASEFVTHRRMAINPRKFMSELFRQQTHLCNMFGQGGEILLIGSDDWRKVLTDSDAPLYRVIAFDGEYYVPRFVDGPLDMKRTGHERKHMRVCIVPWMRGMVIVPYEALHRTAPHM